MAGNGEEQAEHHEKVGRLEAEVHTLTKAVEKLFGKFDEFVAASSRPISLGVILGAGSFLLMLIGALLTFVTYVSNANVAPVVGQLRQTTDAVQSVNAMVMQNAGGLQLLNKEISTIDNKATGNQDTLQWMIFEENLPKQIAKLQGDLDLINQRLDLHVKHTTGANK
jgi:hypothetical protein